MDGQVDSRELRKTLRPLLKEAGWSSFTRNLYTGHIALSLGNSQIAKDRLSQAASSPSYAEVRQRIETDLSSL